jgi:hypothetical protein
MRLWEPDIETSIGTKHELGGGRECRANLVIAILWVRIVAQNPPVLNVETIIVRIPDVLHADFAKHPLRRFIFGAHQCGRSLRVRW